MSSRQSFGPTVAVRSPGAVGLALGCVSSCRWLVLAEHGPLRQAPWQVLEMGTCTENYDSAGRRGTRGTFRKRGGDAGSSCLEKVEDGFTQVETLNPGQAGTQV